MSYKRITSCYFLLISILAVSLIFFIGLDSVQIVSAKDTHAQVTKKQQRHLKKAQYDLKQYQYSQAKKQLSGQKNKKAQLLRKQINDKQKSLITWDDPNKISHLFFHSLIVDTDKAFSSKQAQGYKDYMVSIPEFKSMLSQLYQKGYVLVNFKDLIKTDKQGQVHFKQVKLPQGKKPLIISQDDVNYYEYMKNSGFATKLLIDKHGSIKNQYIENGRKKVGNYDLVPIVDSFVKHHPDFSYGGAKGIIAETGYNGALGYRSSKKEYGNNKKTKKAAKQAKKVANKIKQEGWQFASHSFGHINMTEASVGEIKQDNTLWQKEVAPIVGKTDILIYPFGADIGPYTDYSSNNPKYAYLRQQGFKIFDNVDASHTSWGQLTDDYYRNARINVDGIRLQDDINGQNKVLDPFFNSQQVTQQK